MAVTAKTMGGTVFEYGIYESFEVILCARCSVPFGVPSKLIQHLRGSKEMFCCPHGHANYYGESTEDKLRKEVARKQAALDQANAEAAFQKKCADKQYAARLTAEKGRNIVSDKLKAVKARVKNGVCPECNRYFANLYAHMKCKHARTTGPAAKGGG